MFSLWNEQHTQKAVASAQLIFGFAALYFALTEDVGAFVLPATLSIAHALSKLGEEQDSIPKPKMNN